MALTLDDKWDELRGSHVLCCLTLDSDYDYCYQVKWCFAHDKKHKIYQTTAYDTAQEALDAAYKQITRSMPWEDYTAGEGK
jgi:hypothetical protein